LRSAKTQVLDVLTNLNLQIIIFIFFLFLSKLPKKKLKKKVTLTSVFHDCKVYQRFGLNFDKRCQMISIDKSLLTTFKVSNNFLGGFVGIV